MIAAMDGSNNAYYEPLLFQPQPTTSLDLPVVFSTSMGGEEQDMHRISFEGMDSSYHVFDPCYASSLNCGHPMPDTPLQQWMHYSEEQQALSPYPRQTFLPGGMGSLSPVPVETDWAQSREHKQNRSISRAPSFTSMASSWTSCRRSDQSRSDVSRSASPNANEMARWGQQQEHGTWRCAYPGCTSKSIFRRGCDLRKHYRRHTKSLFCRHAGCKQSTEGGFSSEKDRARHEAKHDPQITCEWKGCSRVFSRVDNMRDHVRRIHRKHAK